MQDVPLLDDDSEVSPIPVNKFSIWTLFKWPLLLFLPFWVVGALFKIQSWPYASELLTVGVFVFLFVSMLVVIFRTVSEKSMAVFAYSFFGLASVNLFIIGALFKIQSWPYASEIRITGLIAIALFVLLKVIIASRPKK